MIKQEYCKYCGEKNNLSHHCSGKKAYYKGWNDCVLNKDLPVKEIVDEIDKIVEKI